MGLPFALHHNNFAALPSVLAAEGVSRVDGVLADLGMSSMQVDDPERGFSYVRDGPLDMRMDRSRGRSAAQLLATISQADLARALRELGDDVSWATNQMPSGSRLQLSPPVSTAHSRGPKTWPEWSSKPSVAIVPSRGVCIPLRASGI
jgi:hypothetical protein